LNDTDVIKIIIAGSRGFSDYEFLCAKMDFLLKNSERKICIIGGEARGADTFGKRYAVERGYQYLSFPADWKAHGKSAGYIRNQEMGDNAEALAAFWDGVSKGTKHMIDYAKGKGLTVRVIKYKPKSRPM